MNRSSPDRARRAFARLPPPGNGRACRALGESAWSWSRTLDRPRSRSSRLARAPSSRTSNPRRHERRANCCGSGASPGAMPASVRRILSAPCPATCGYDNKRNGLPDHVRCSIAVTRKTEDMRSRHWLSVVRHSAQHRRGRRGACGGCSIRRSERGLCPQDRFRRHPHRARRRARVAINRS